MSLETPYAIVEFLDPQGASTAIVCTSWLLGRDKCYWPEVSQSKMMRMLRENVACDGDKDKSYPCRFLGTSCK